MHKYTETRPVKSAECIFHRKDSLIFPLVSSQIEITRKCIKERINQIERLCSNQKKTMASSQAPLGGGHYQLHNCGLCNLKFSGLKSEISSCFLS